MGVSMSGEKRMRRWVDIPWPEIAESKGKQIAFVVVGSVEQHGFHLPLGTDVYIPEGITDLLFRKLEERKSPLAARCTMLPPFFYTYAKESDVWPGTLNLDGQTFTATVRDVLGNLFRQGVGDVVIVNGHMEGLGFVLEGIELAREKFPAGRVLSVNWWDFVSDELIEEVFKDKWPGWIAEHAALTETSLMLYFRPELVKLEKMDAGFIPKPKLYKLFPQPGEMRPASGMFAPATDASAQIGELVANRIADGLAQVLEEVFRPS